MAARRTCAGTDELTARLPGCVPALAPSAAAVYMSSETQLSVCAARSFSVSCVCVLCPPLWPGGGNLCSRDVPRGWETDSGREPVGRPAAAPRPPRSNFPTVNRVNELSIKLPVSCVSNRRHAMLKRGWTSGIQYMTTIIHTIPHRDKLTLLMSCSSQNCIYGR